MATENKRHSVGGKGPGGPASSGGGSPAGAVSMEAALSGAVGARVRIITVAPTAMTLEGTLFTACPITNLVAINTSPLPPTPITPGTPALTTPSDFHIIPISRIQDFRLISLPPQTASSSDSGSPFTNAYPTIYPLDMRALKNREAAAVSALQEREQRRGKGVTKEAQDLFDAFSRTMPARWDGSSIIVADTVVINQPYRVDDCRALAAAEDGGSAALTRVRKVLEMERKKIELRDAGAAIANSGSFQRQHNYSNAGTKNDSTSTNTDTNTSPDANTPVSSNANTNASTPTTRTRQTDSKAAAVAMPIPKPNMVRSPPPGGQRKGG